MKKVLRYLLLFLFIVCLFGCVQNTDKKGDSANMSGNENKNITKLSNTYYKLTEDKELNIVFIGGSVTEGMGSTNAKATSWPALVVKNLEYQYPKAVINHSNLAIGGTSSEFASFRYMREISPKNPDILFIEYYNHFYTRTYNPIACFRNMFSSYIHSCKTIYRRLSR